MIFNGTRLGHSIFNATRPSDDNSLFPVINEKSLLKNEQQSIEVIKDNESSK